MKQILKRLALILALCLFAFGSTNFADTTITGMSAIQIESAPQYAQSLESDKIPVIHTTHDTNMQQLLNEPIYKISEPETHNKYLTLLLLLLWLVI